MVGKKILTALLSLVMCVSTITANVNVSVKAEENTSRVEKIMANMAVGATYTQYGTEYAKMSGQIIGRELAALGINANFAPTVDVNNNTTDLANLDTIIAAIETAVANGKITEARLNESVERILNLKEKRGILDYDAEKYTLEKAEKEVGSQQNRDEEREITTAAVTVVKNNDNVLSLQPKAGEKVLFLGAYNNELPLMKYYEVYRSANNGTYRLLKRTEPTQAVNTSLKQGSTYNYKVRAYNLVDSVKVYTDFSQEISVIIE